MESSLNSINSVNSMRAVSNVKSEDGVNNYSSVNNRLRRCIATINRWTDYCINREIIVVIIFDVSKTSQNNRS